MSETTLAQRPPEPDWSAITDEELVGYREAENRVRASAAARVITGEPDPGAAIAWRELALPGRDLPVRVHRPVGGNDVLPLVLHVHGGGFVGTAAQCDWVTSHVAARLPAVVVSVEHRLLDAATPLAAAVDDGWDALRHLLDHAGQWGVDPARTAVFGESCGALICALAAIRAEDSRPAAAGAGAGQPRRRRDRHDVRLPVGHRVRRQPDAHHRAAAAVPAARRAAGHRRPRGFPAVRGKSRRTGAGCSWWCRPTTRWPTTAVVAAVEAARGRDFRAAQRIPRRRARVPQHAGRGAAGRGRAGGDPRVPPHRPRRGSAPMTRTERGAITALYAGLGLTVLATVVPYPTHL